MLNPANHNKKKNGHIISRKSSVNIISRQNGRTHTRKYLVDKGPATSSKAVNPTAYDEDFTMHDGAMMEQVAVVDPNIIMVSQNQQRKTKSQNDMLNDWLAKEDRYMDVLLDFEDIGEAASCGHCNKAGHSLFRCKTCLGNSNYCQGCTVRMHQGTPFHRIAVWDETTGCFRDVSLAETGLVIKLGHTTPCNVCPNPGSPLGVTTVHTNGLHSVTVQPCYCSRAKSLDLQLFDQRLFSASVQNPQTVFSFAVLEQFRYYHLEGKGSAYTFMNALYRLTDDTGRVGLEDRIREFRRVFRQWTYLQTKKTSGRYGSSSQSLPLIVACPACPQPGKNLSDRWIDEVPPDKHWLHRQFLHFDANFKLILDKRTTRAEGNKSLWGGEGYFVETDQYRRYLEAADPPRREASDCVDHRAVLQTSRTRFESLEVSGVAGAVCRHECAIPQSFVNLTHGERYVNSDYGISSAFREMRPLKEAVISYDIACQYSRKFEERFAASPALEVPHCSLIFAVPKFHLPAHKDACRYLYSFNYLKNVGRTDGEAIERFWSRHNFLSGSTRRMSPETRLDTLNAHFSDWNWRKLCGMGEAIQSRLIEAQEQVYAHNIRFTELKASLSNADVVRWTEADDAYVPARGMRSPYELATEEAPTRVSILQQLTQIRDPANARQDHIVPNGQAAAALWINDGLELEDEQRSLRIHASTINAGSTERERVLLARRRTTLHNRYTAWKADSPLGDDAQDDLDAEEDDLDNGSFEDTRLPLPFTLADNGTELTRELHRLERDLRAGQADDALKQLRKALALRLVLLRDARQHHGRDYFRSQATIKRTDQDIEFSASRYKAAYLALEILGLGAENRRFKTLTAEDINLAHVFTSPRGLGRGYETEDISWIWRMEGLRVGLGDDDWLKEVLRVQFLDAKTTLDRWREELELTTAELLRTADYFKWVADFWGYRVRESHTRGERAHGSSMRVIFEDLERNIRLRLL